MQSFSCSWSLLDASPSPSPGVIFPGPSINKQLEQLERYSTNTPLAPALAAGSLPATVPAVSVGVAWGVSGSHQWAGAASEHQQSAAAPSLLCTAHPAAEGQLQN